MVEINEAQVAWVIGACNQIDDRVQMNNATKRRWMQQFAGLTFQQVQDGCDRFYAKPWNSDYPRPVIDPANLRRDILEHAARDKAKDRADKALPFKRPSHTFRGKDPEKWDRLVREGRDKHREDLQRRGIPLKAWQTTDTLNGPHGDQHR